MTAGPTRILTVGDALVDVIVEPARAAELPEIDEYEEEMLAELDKREPTSRLSCQLSYEPELADLTLTVAPRG